MTEIHNLSAEKRERAGKGAARAARRAGRVPAVIYGGPKEPVMITLEDRVIRRELQKAGFFTTLFDVQVEGATERVLPRDVQFHPVTDFPLHVDFLRVSAETRVTVMVPVHFAHEDVCPGIKKGGVLNIVRHEVELSCTSDHIPDHITFDLSGYDVGESIHISAVSLPEGVRPTITDRDFTVATIVAPSGMKAAAAEAAAAEEAEEA